MENKYNNAKIYKIVSNTTGECYFGSTTEQTLTKRLVRHRGSYKYYLNNNKLYCTSFKILETNDYDIILVENVNCNNKDELRARERYYIENNDCVNKNIPFRTNDEKKEFYKEYKKEYHKKYNQDYKQKKQQYNKQYYQENKQKIICECGCELLQRYLSMHKSSKKHILLMQNKKQNNEQNTEQTE